MVKDMAVMFVDPALYPMPMNTPSGIVYALPWHNLFLTCCLSLDPGMFESIQSIEKQDTLDLFS